MELEAHPPVDVTPTHDLAKELAQTVGQLVARHVELAKVEAIAQAKREAKMASMLVAAGALAYAGLLVFLAACTLLLALALPGWAAAFIIAGAVFLGSGVLAALGFKRRVKRPLWRTRETIEEDVRWLRPRTA